MTEHAERAVRSLVLAIEYYDALDLHASRESLANALVELEKALTFFNLPLED